MRRWADLEPALVGSRCAAPPGLAALAGLARLAAELRPGVDPQRADDVLGALVRLAAVDGHGDPDALLALLHLLSDGARALAGRLPDPSGNALALVVGELALQIRAFPWRRRTRAYAANLLLDTNAALVREVRPHRTRTYPSVVEVLVDPTDRERVTALLDRTSPGPDGGEDLDLRDLLVWAARTGVADAGDVALLLQVERAREAGGPAQLQVAQARGINERTLRRRREKTLAALQAASASYLAACA